MISKTITYILCYTCTEQFMMYSNSLNFFCTKKIFILFLLGHISIVCGQNLVSNFSFEESTNCPVAISELNLASPWFTPTSGTSDYYNSCWNISSGGVSVDVPANFNGVQAARSGHAYAGIAAYSPLVDYREYIEIELDSALKPGIEYCVSFYVNLSDGSNYTINKIQMLITDTIVQNFSSFGAIITTPQISSNSMIADNMNWTEVSGTYTANGGERFITIGCFEDSADVLYTELPTYIPDWFGYGVYFIDDVSVQECNIDPVDTLDPIIDTSYYTFYIPNSFTPNQDELNSFFGPKGMGVSKYTMEIFNHWGENIFTSNSISNLWNGKYKDFDCPQGIYTYKIYYEFENGLEFQKIGSVNLIR
jgi:gliding motility-associated-like protein